MRWFDVPKWLSYTRAARKSFTGVYKATTSSLTVEAYKQSNIQCSDWLPRSAQGLLMPPLSRSPWTLSKKWGPRWAITTRMQQKHSLRLPRLPWIYYPGPAGAIANEQGHKLASRTDTTERTVPLYFVITPVCVCPTQHDTQNHT